MTEPKPAEGNGPLEMAKADVERLSKKRLDFVRKGPDLDRDHLAEVDAELTAAGERLGATDLAVKKASSRAPFNVEKFCAQQIRVSDLQQTVANRSVEFNEVHSRLNALKNAISTFENSEDSRTLARSLQAAGGGKKMGAEDLKIAREIADLRARLIAAESTRTRAAPVWRASACKGQFSRPGRKAAPPRARRVVNQFLTNRRTISQVFKRGSACRNGN